MAMFVECCCRATRRDGLKAQGLLWPLIAILAVAAPYPSEAQQAQDISLPAGFRAELVYTVPFEEQGSWVSLTVDDRGRLIASDQYGALYRIEPSEIGASADNTRVEKLDVGLGSAQGLLFAHDSLYVTVNGTFGGFSSGLYRITDTNDDDQFDRIEQLRAWKGQGEHGPHAIVLSPDGESLYVCAGNHTNPPYYSRTFVPPNWAEDQVLPRIFDPGGHATNIKAPGGWVARMDLNGDDLEFLCAGFRNEYDIALNDDGELFTFDADMEWDIGTPWYRPTRICHIVKGADYGWRSGNGKRPSYYIDTLPPVADVGPGSPTGISFGRGTAFPPEYQQALFAGDWSYGNIYAIHMAPDGASYTGIVEPFATASPLGVTDIVVRPQDGALYFAVGGRKTQSALFRIVWDGDAIDPQLKSDLAELAAQATPAAEAAEARALRERLASLQLNPSPEAVEQLWPYLASQDRFLRNAARVALERQPLESWLDRGLRDTNPRIRIAALAAAARSGGQVPTDSWVESLIRIDFANLPINDQLDAVRTAGLGLLRLGPFSLDAKQQLRDALDPSLPSGDSRLNIELAQLLIELDAPNLVDRVLPLIDAADTQEEEIAIAVALSIIKRGWTQQQRERLLDWFIDASNTGGGMSCFGYLESARDRFIAGFSSAQRAALQERISQPLSQAPAQLESVNRPVVKEWELHELVQLADADLGKRDFERGRRMFAAASCYQCHRVAGSGSTIGPDLTGAGGRFNTTDLLRAIVDPSQQISDQYQQTMFFSNGRVVTGRVTNLNERGIHISTNMLDPKTTVVLAADEIDQQRPSDVSVMPDGLLNTLNEEEILDLLAFLRSGGDPQSDVYRQGSE